MSEGNRHPLRIEGAELLITPSSYQYELRPAATPWVSATGRQRMQYAYWGEGLPDVRMSHHITLEYRKLGEYHRLLNFLLSRAGVLMVTLWRPVELSWTCDGSRSEFLLPWDHAPYVDPLPSTDKLGSDFAPTVATALPTMGGDLIVAEVDAAAYGAGSPPAGQAWIDRDNQGRKIKLAAPPDKGTVVYASMTPRVPMLLSARQPRQLNRGTETLSLTLDESDS